ncbi:uncharacterized protein LOC131609164 [Vicia villosa]|uniref:uncharacterized protein LOC131609164 n=1 Tax=Vicia villosa TaxID=3911 RepID=UPI00273CA1D5|nr:uncharacterized protein LOC131609164 [Vicia villosa]
MIPIKLTSSPLNLRTAKMDSKENQHPVMYQNVIVMRHSERLDNVEPTWVSTATRPWDPPLTQSGRVLAFKTGQGIRKNFGFPIHRLFVSPFLRCVQTAAEIVTALSDVNEAGGSVSHDDISADPSKVKVSIENGLCEMLNTIAIRVNVAPKDGNFSFDISELETMFPNGTVDNDNNEEMVQKELPKWEESVSQANVRYQQAITSLADKYPTENLLLVTHGEGTQVALSSYTKDVVEHKVKYCGFVQLTRPIFKNDHSFIGGKFNLQTHIGQNGVNYISSQEL